MRKKFVTMIAILAIAVCSSMACLLFAFADDTAPAEPELQFLDVGMGGADWTYATADQNLPPKTTNWGQGIGLTFTANIYDIGTQYQKPIQDTETEVSDGADGFKTNKQLVEYVAATGNASHTIETIWYDTQGRLVFVIDNASDPSALDTVTDPLTGLPFYKYGDGDRVTVRAGFVFPYNDGTQNKTLTLGHDVTVEYDATAHDWHEVVAEGGTARIRMATAADVTASIVNANGIWGHRISLFADGTRPDGFADTNTNNEITAGTLKAIGKTDASGGNYGYGYRVFLWDRMHASYIGANGTEQTINEIYFSNAGVALRTDVSGIATAQEGDKILLKKGFREGYYYGNLEEYWLNSYGQYVVSDSYGAFQPLRVLGENVLLVYKSGAWTKASLAPSTVDFSARTKALAHIYKDQSIQLTYNDTIDEIPEYSTSNASVVSVDANGFLMGGDTAGSATITAAFINKTLTLTVENKTTEPVVSGIAATTKAAYGAVVLYKGEDNDAAAVLRQITALATYDNGYAGGALTLTADDIDFTGYDKDLVYKKGDASTVQSIKVTSGGKETSVPVHVYAVSTINPPAQNSSSVANWGGAIEIIFSSIAADTNVGAPSMDADTLKALGQYDKIIVKAAEYNGGERYNVHTVNYIYNRDITPTLEDGHSDPKNLTIGDTLTLLDGVRIYYQDQGAWIASAEMKGEFKMVWNGELWVKFEAEATDIALAETEVSLAVGGYYKIPYAVQPAGAIAHAVIESTSDAIEVSDDGQFIFVKSLSADPVEIFLQLGANQSTRKTFTVTTVESALVGYEMYEPRNYIVANGGAFELFHYYGDSAEKLPLMAMAKYENGSNGEPFALTEDNTEIVEFDNKTEGARKITLRVTPEGGTATYDIVVDATVRRFVPQVSSGVMADPWNEGKAKFFIVYSQTFAGAVNVPKELMQEWNVAQYVTFVRDGTEYAVTALIQGNFLVLEPDFAGADMPAEETVKFKEGDKFILAPGLPMYEWSGKDNAYSPVGVGQYVKTGTVEYETVYECLNGTDMWDTLIDYEDFTLASETVEVGLGKLKDAGAMMVPSYATIGEFELVSSDPSIVSINASGLLKGEKVGTTTVIVTLDGGAKGSISKTLTVNVVDVISGIKFETEKIYVKTGTPLTGAVLVEQGIQAKFVWASGAVDGDVDFSKATVIGFDANKKGEQEISVRIVKDGISVTGKLTVVVNASGKAPKKKGCGCGSLAGYGVAGGITAAFAMLAFGGALCLVSLRKKHRED